MRGLGDLDVTDFFCGMGGSSSGLTEAGWSVKLAANHWQTAIDTHSANHPDTEHLCADLQAVDLRYLPRTRALWASPICTEVSPAGGRRRKSQSGPSLFEEHGHVPNAAFERTRVTFWEVIRATEIHRYDAIMIENVVEAADWELFPVWLSGMETLGYEAQFVSVSAAHVGGTANPHAPQWRDRMYIAFRRKGLKPFDLEPRPIAWCDKCGEVVEAIQWWKRDGRRVGKYGRQYIYACPNGSHGQVEPYVAPAAHAIDWSDIGTRIGDRQRPLAAATMRRIQTGLDMLAAGEFDREYVMAVNHDSGRYFDPRSWPMPTSTIKRGEGLVVVNRTHNQPASLDDPLAPMTTGRNHGLVVAAAGNTYDAATRGVEGYTRAWGADSSPLQTQATTGQLGLVTTLRRNGDTIPADDAPLTTMAASGFHHGLVVKSNGGQLEDRHAIKPDGEPLPTSRSTVSDFLVVPYRKRVKPHKTTEPIGTQATREQHGVMRAAPDIDDCYFRMLSPREAANAQRFDRDYVIRGTKGERQMQAGNAVAVNVAHWIGRQVADGLDG